MNDKHKNFLKELADLSKRYDLWIAGCGCCGSPSASSINDDELQEYEASEWTSDRETGITNINPIKKPKEEN